MLTIATASSVKAGSSRPLLDAFLGRRSVGRSDGLPLASHGRLLLVIGQCECNRAFFRSVR
jgi:hypothetical protein